VSDQFRVSFVISQHYLFAGTPVSLFPLALQFSWGQSCLVGVGGRDGVADVNALLSERRLYVVATSVLLR
jgi:hypothetical protein